MTVVKEDEDAVTVRKMERSRDWPFVVGAAILKPTFWLTVRREWIDGDKIPATGGCILVANHLSHLDPLTTAHLVYDYGRLPRYLAKSGLFENGGLSYFLRSAGQIPVKRLTSDAVGAYDAAVEAVRAGECVVVYPEGTITREPDLWPMRGKTGAARIALETEAPVIPMAHWGVQDILAPYAKKPHVFPKKTVTYKVGDPVPLDDLRATERTAQTAREATERIMSAITALLEDIRGEKAPAERYDPRTAGVRETGNPNDPDSPRHTRKDNGR